MTADAVQSVLAPAGAQASTIYHLWSLMLWVATAVFTIVSGAVLIAACRRRERSSTRPDPRVEGTLSRIVAAAVAVTAVILLALLSVSVWTGRTVASLQASSAVTV